MGLNYGVSFQAIKAIHRGENIIIAELSTTLSTKGYCIHPVLLDAALQASAALNVKKAAIIQACIYLG